MRILYYIYHYIVCVRIYVMATQFIIIFFLIVQRHIINSWNGSIEAWQFLEMNQYVITSI